MVKFLSLDPAHITLSCIWEVSARKVGNVHPGSAFTGTNSIDFLTSAALLREAFYGWSSRGVGKLVLSGVEATRTVTDQNTNLGIALLLAPLKLASEQVNEMKRRQDFLRHATEQGWGTDDLPTVDGPTELRLGLDKLLQELSVEDAEDVYQAIRLAQPGGLGEASEQDVRDEPTVTLLEAMRLAADRDLIARQYANGFADVFDFGVPAFLAAFERFGCVEAAVIDCQLRWLAEYPDSLIARKKGLPVAEDVRQRVSEVMRLGGLETPEGRAAGVALDRHLRSDGNKLNPGTTADLVTACLFVALREGKVKPSAPFKWDVPDWL